MITEGNLHRPSIQSGFHEDIGTIACQLRQYLHQLGAAQTKERAISNDLQCNIFDEKCANEHLKRQLMALGEFQEAQITLESLQEDLMKLTLLTPS